MNGCDWMLVLVGVFDVLGGEVGVGDGVVELGVEFGWFEGFFVEFGVDDGVGEVVLVCDGGFVLEVGCVGIVGGVVGGIDSVDGFDE